MFREIKTDSFYSKKRHTNTKFTEPAFSVGRSQDPDRLSKNLFCKHSYQDSVIPTLLASQKMDKVNFNSLVIED